ncbi:hypothetical protein IMCC1989_1060 [gamma proteobacterium IMCC1989]|nr:hypothetical protein IMCC1989_1060 [gamma proteobacterium IMCC1989]
MGATNATIGNYINIDFEAFGYGVTDVIRVFKNGDAPAGETDGTPSMKLEMLGIDLSPLGATEADILTKLITDGNLIVE